jgi:hypothetical protein
VIAARNLETNRTRCFSRAVFVVGALVKKTRKEVAQPIDRHSLSRAIQCRGPTAPRIVDLRVSIFFKKNDGHRQSGIA